MPGPETSDLPAGAPLHGVRVLELSRVLAGPYACRLLADLGADVIKVEPPDGDLARLIAPRHDRGMSGLYTLGNVGKRNVCIDLRAPGGAQLVQELALRCDVIVENFRPSVADRLGFGWDTIHATNPRTVMLSINGFGSDSSQRERRAFAPILHAATGILDDQARYSGGPVTQIAHAYGDVATALHGVIGVLAALREAERTGVGQRVEIAMFDAILASYSDTAYALVDPPGRGSDTNPLFDAGPNGHFALAGPPQHIWRELRATFPDLEDPAPGEIDVPTKARLRREVMERWMAGHAGPAALIASLERAGIASSPVETLRDALTGPLARERGLLVEVDDRRGGTRPVVRSPYGFSGASDAPAVAVRGPAPRRGEHNREVLRELLGLGDDTLRELEEAGTLAAADEDAP